MKPITAVLVRPVTTILGFPATETAPMEEPPKDLEEITLTEYGDYRKLIGGWIEAVSLRYIPTHYTDDESLGTPGYHADPGTPIEFTMWVDEEYLIKGLDVLEWNFVATSVAASCGRPDLLMQGILGNVVVTGPADGQGETRPIPSEIIGLLKKVHAQVITEVM